MEKSTNLEIGEWYTSKRGHIFRLDDINKDGSVIVTAHTTGNKISIPEEETEYFTITDEPKTAPGTFLASSESKSPKDIKKETNTYEKYPHIIPGSIYKVKNSSPDKKGSFKLKTSVRGATRCKIRCKECGAARDIKVQDAFQVKFCVDCKKKQRRAKTKGKETDKNE